MEDITAGVVLPLHTMPAVELRISARRSKHGGCTVVARVAAAAEERIDRVEGSLYLMMLILLYRRRMQKKDRSYFTIDTAQRFIATLGPRGM